MMETTAYPARFVADDPTQRLPWVLSIAVLLVLFSMVGIGNVLKLPARPVTKPITPMEETIYELPASNGMQPGHLAPHAVSTPPTPPAYRVNRAVEPPPARHGELPQQLPGPKVQANTPARHRINLATLQSQIDSAVATGTSNDAAPPQFHDPHTLVAHYYLASLMSKLERVGDMNYPTGLTGVALLRLVVGSDGELLKVKLLHSSGSAALDADALQIVRESAPFAPFPDQLRHQAPYVDMKCYMSFEGNRHIDSNL